MAECVFDPPDRELEVVCRAAEAATRAAEAAEALANRSSSLADWSGLLEVLVSAILPLAAIAFLFFMAKPLRTVIESRKFTVKIGGMELSAQEASDQLRERVDELARRMAEIDAGTAAEAATGAVRTMAMPEPPTTKERLTILWVDDRPMNNAFEVAGLTAKGHEVVQCTSTEEALAFLKRRSPDVILSDMGRPEGRDAGLDLLRRLRDDGDETPFGFYTSQKTIARHAEAFDELKPFVATSLYVTLLRGLSQFTTPEG